MLAATVALVLGARLGVTRLRRAENERREADRRRDGPSTEGLRAEAPSSGAVATSEQRAGSGVLHGIPAIRHFFRTNETPSSNPTCRARTNPMRRSRPFIFGGLADETLSKKNHVPMLPGTDQEGTTDP